MEQSSADSATTDAAIPGDVREAGHLILAAMALSVIDAMDILDRTIPSQKSAVLVGVILLTFLFGALTVWLVVKIRRGRNWARWTMLALLALGWVVFGLDARETWARSPLVGIADVAIMAMEMVACIFLFSGASGKWFAATGPTR